MNKLIEQLIQVSSKDQVLICYEDKKTYFKFPISTGKNGLGEEKGSEKTPRGWHQIYSKIGMDVPKNAVFIGRKWHNEIYTQALAAKFPNRDWILSRILQLDGLEPGKNKGGEVDTLSRYIYIHGTPDDSFLGQPGSKGCIRMNNEDIIKLANWVQIGTKVYIE